MGSVSRDLPSESGGLVPPLCWARSSRLLRLRSSCWALRGAQAGLTASMHSEKRTKLIKERLQTSFAPPPHSWMICAHSISPGYEGGTGSFSQNRRPSHVNIQKTEDPCPNQNVLTLKYIFAHLLGHFVAFTFLQRVTCSAGSATSDRPRLEAFPALLTFPEEVLNLPGEPPAVSTSSSQNRWSKKPNELSVVKSCLAKYLLCLRLCKGECTCASECCYRDKR